MMQKFKVIGVVHLLPLPGTPRSVPFNDVVERALFDARQLEAGGVETAIIENFGDAPFVRGAVEPHVVSMMTRIGLAIKQQTNLRLGVNVLRNDSIASLAIAAACQAAFIRVNVHVGSAWTDQGLIQGEAYRTLMYRKQLGCDVDIAADIFVKHASPAGVFNIVDVAQDTLYRGLAKQIILTGSGTGKETDLALVQEVSKAIPASELWIGSGLDLDNVAGYVPIANGGIVGSYFHEDGDVTAPLSRERIARFMNVVRSL